MARRLSMPYAVAGVARRARVSRTGMCALPPRIRNLQNPWAIGAFVRSGAFARFVEKARRRRSQPANLNPKAVVEDFAPLAVLPPMLARRIGAKSRVLRLTAPVADKQWWRHGPRAKDKRRRVPVSWYADILRILRDARPYQAGKKRKPNRWQFDHARLQRRVVVDLDERGNPALISYHPKKFGKNSAAYRKSGQLGGALAGELEGDCQHQRPDAIGNDDRICTGGIAIWSRRAWNCADVEIMPLSAVLSRGFGRFLATFSGDFPPEFCRFLP